MIIAIIIITIIIIIIVITIIVTIIIMDLCLADCRCRVFLIPVAFYALDCLSDKPSWYLQIPLFEQAIFPSGRSPC